MTDMPLRLFNSLTRQIEDFVPLTPGKARVYTCGPTVYNYQHIGNMRAYIFADTLGRALRFKGHEVEHVVNITDVGHLTSDADAGDDKMEKAASAAGKSAWDIARFYQADFENDLARLNINSVQHPKATDYVPQMIEWAKSIADTHCYQLEGGLYFDTSKVPNYGALARARTDEGQSRIDPVPGKRHPQDFAIWRTTPPGETRQMEWDSPWGRGAPGWHIECSVMSHALLGFPFDIHTGGIDHREIHHPCEIAQNQAHYPDLPTEAATGARFWMHNNFLIDRRGKMSKSSGEFLRLQTLVDKGFHPLAYRLMCLQAHYRSEMEFTWEGLLSARTRLNRWLIAIEQLKIRNATHDPIRSGPKATSFNVGGFDEAVSNDLSTPEMLTDVDFVLLGKNAVPAATQLDSLAEIDAVLGLNLLTLTRQELRIRPATATLTEAGIETRLTERKAARAARDFATSDRIRDELIAAGVEVMDGDPIGWDWKPDI